MYKDASAKTVEGVYNNKKIAVAAKEPSMRCQTMVTKAKAWALTEREMPQNPHGSRASHRLASKEVPIRAPHKSLRPGMAVDCSERLQCRLWKMYRNLLRPAHQEERLERDREWCWVSVLLLIDFSSAIVLG